MKNRRFYKSHRGLLILAALSLSVVMWVMLLNYISPEEIVDSIGINNGYLVLFLVAFFGGMSSFSGASYIATVLTLAAGGLDPILLALVSGVGISLSDTLFYWVGHHSQHLIESPKILQKLERVSEWLSRQSRLIIGLCIYAYTSFTPLPTDLITLTLGLTRQPYLLVIVALTLGNFTFTYLLATLGSSFLTF